MKTQSVSQIRTSTRNIFPWMTKTLSVDQSWKSTQLINIPVRLALLTNNLITLRVKTSELTIIPTYDERGLSCATKSITSPSSGAWTTYYSTIVISLVQTTYKSILTHFNHPSKEGQRRLQILNCFLSISKCKILSFTLPHGAKKKGCIKRTWKLLSNSTLTLHEKLANTREK